MRLRGLLILFCFFTFTAECDEAESLEKLSASPDDCKLVVAITAMKRVGDKLHFSYIFRWDETRHEEFNFEYPFGIIRVHCWDAKGKRLEKEAAIDYLFKGFWVKRVKTHEGKAVVQLPEGAVFFSYQLGTPGIETREVPIPKE
jgi:hypothetical protein